MTKYETRLRGARNRVCEALALIAPDRPEAETLRDVADKLALLIAGAATQPEKVAA